MQHINSTSSSMNRFSRPVFRFFLQLLFWILLLGSVSSVFLWIGLPQHLLWRNLVVLLSIVLLLLLNIYYLFPRYLAPKRYGLYFVLAAGSCVLILMVGTIIDLEVWDLPAVFQRSGLVPFADRPRSFYIIPPTFLKGLFFFFATMSSSLVEHIHLQQERISDPKNQAH